MIFVNENENENEKMMKTKTKLKRKNNWKTKTKTKKIKTKITLLRAKLETSSLKVLSQCIEFPKYLHFLCFVWQIVFCFCACSFKKNKYTTNILLIQAIMCLNEIRRRRAQDICSNCWKCRKNVSTYAAKVLKFNRKSFSTLHTVINLSRSTNLCSRTVICCT